MARQTNQVWIPERGFVELDQASADDLALANDARWMLGRPAESLAGISAAKRRQVQPGIDLADVEKLILDDPWIGPNQRKTLLREVRALSHLVKSREEFGDES